MLIYSVDRFPQLPRPLQAVREVNGPKQIEYAVIAVTSTDNAGLPKKGDGDRFIIRTENGTNDNGGLVWDLIALDRGGNRVLTGDDLSWLKLIGQGFDRQRISLQRLRAEIESHGADTKFPYTMRIVGADHLGVEVRGDITGSNLVMTDSLTGEAMRVLTNLTPVASVGSDFKRLRFSSDERITIYQDPFILPYTLQPGR